MGETSLGSERPQGNRVMSEKNGNDDTDESIFRVDTVPPPAGDDDAYNAPTRVGPE